MRNKFLLDTSALINIRDELSVERVIDGHVDLYITDLTPFEFGNVLWKAFIRGRITEKIAVTEIKFLEKLIDVGALKVLPLDSPKDAMEASLKLKITFYDASYLVIAKKKSLVLVSDDNGLLEASKTIRIEAINSGAFKEKCKEVFQK